MASKFVPWVNDSNVSSNTVDVSSKVATGFQSGNKAIAKEVNAVLRSTSVVVSALMNVLMPNSLDDYATSLSTLTSDLDVALHNLVPYNASNATNWGGKSLSDVFKALTGPDPGYSNTVLRADVSNSTEVNTLSDNVGTLGGFNVYFKSPPAYGATTPTLAKMTNNFTYSPATDTLHVTNLDGNALTATKASAADYVGVTASTSLATTFTPGQINTFQMVRDSDTQLSKELDVTSGHILLADTIYLINVYTSAGTGLGNMFLNLGTVIFGEEASITGIPLYEADILSSEVTGGSHPIKIVIKADDSAPYKFTSGSTWYVQVIPFVKAIPQSL